jgi:hypothetical protein
MKNEMMKNEITAQLRLPLQMAPVERRVAGSALSGQDGVGPSFDWGGFLQKAIPIATNILGGLL